jgi:aspartyl-tRNA(Asn)/glutamyl-tRNA(Gln) amidotransferase subunit A
MAAASSFDQIGAIGKTLDDVQIIFDFVKGFDPLDSTSYKNKGSNFRNNKKIKVGIPKGFVVGEGIDKEIMKNFNESLIRIKTLGYEVEEIDFPYLKYSLATYYTLVFAEEASNLARFDGVKYGLHKEGINMVEDYFKTRQAGFGREVKRRIILGTYILSSGYYDAYYNKANIVRDLICEDYKKAFAKVDVIITPTTPSPAFKIGEKISDPLQLYLEDIFTVPANLTGLPAISIPCGFKEVEGKKLPLGLQMMAFQGGEDILFALAKAFEN